MRRPTRNQPTGDQASAKETAMENDENTDTTFSSNASSMRAKRGPKRMATAVEPVLEEEEEVMQKDVKAKAEKEENLSLADMVNRLCEGGSKGEVKLIKTLLAMKGDFTDKVDKNTLRRILWTTSVAATHEGRKLQNLMMFEIGIKKAFVLIQNRVIKDDFKATDAKNYGLMLLSAYLSAIARDKSNYQWENEEGPQTNAIIEGFTEISRGAILVFGNIGEKFLGILQTFLDMPDRFKYDSLISKCLDTHLWRSLKAAHDQVRYNASRILLRFFPIIDKNVEDPVTLETQYEYMITMLSDVCVEIRREAATKIQKVLAMFYSMAPLKTISRIMKHIVAETSYDSIPAVRVAVLEGFMHLIPVPEAINVTERGLKTMLPRLFEDRNEKVRLTAVRLLLKMRGHRLIKYFDVVPMEMIMDRLECETSDAMRKEIVRLVYMSFLPPRASADERNERVVRLIRFGRVAALSFHRLIVPLELATLEDAVAHLKHICIAVYKNWRKGIPESSEMASVDVGDTTMANLDTSIVSNTSIADTSATSIPAIDEDSFVFIRDKTLLECAVVLWATVAKELKKPAHDKERTMVDKLMSKMFRKMFLSFRQTSLLGTVMCIGSLLPSNMLAEYSTTVLSILKEKSVDDEILEPYLAAGASWRIEELMQIVKEGLHELPSVLPGLSFSSNASSSGSRSPQKKRARKSKLSPVERIRQALHYLKYSLSSEPISSKLQAECKQQLVECFEALSHVHEVVDAYLDQMDDNGGSDDEQLKALTPEDMLSLYESATVLAVLMMEMPSTSTAAAPTTRSSRAGSAGSAGAAAAAEGEGAETEDEEAPSSSPYSLFFFVSLHWMESSLITRIGRLSSIDRNKDDLLIRLAKVTLQHAETVLAACPRPPRAPTHAAMAEAVRRLTPPAGATAASSEEEEMAGEGSVRRRYSQASSAGASGSGPPPKSYLERLSAMLSALLHSSTPVVLLKATLQLCEQFLGMDNEEGVDARANSVLMLQAAIAITKRAAEMPYDGEKLRTGHMDALLSITKVVIAKFPHGPAAFEYHHLLGPLRANCQRLLAKAIEERGIEDVTEHSYDLHEYIQLVLHRYIFRDEKIYREFRQHVMKFTLSFAPTETEAEEEEEEEQGEEEEEEMDKNGEKKEPTRERRERMESSRNTDYMRFVIGCMLLRLSAPEIRKAIIKEKKNEKARRSIQTDINTGALFSRLDEWKQAMRMSDGTELILREMIGPK